MIDGVDQYEAFVDVALNGWHIGFETGKDTMQIVFRADIPAVAEKESLERFEEVFDADEVFVRADEREHEVGSYLEYVIVEPELPDNVEETIIKNTSTWVSNSGERDEDSS